MYRKVSEMQHALACAAHPFTLAREITAREFRPEESNGIDQRKPERSE
jgi:hypothetical protein